jgi:hypothetical protein
MAHRNSFASFSDNFWLQTEAESAVDVLQNLCGGPYLTWRNRARDLSITAWRQYKRENAKAA